MGGSSKKQTVGYKYLLGMHLIWCHGPVDLIKRFSVDGRIAWSGFTRGGRISINAAELFGGESREGGIVGEVDVEMGAPDQGRNDYLQSQLGTAIPAYRGVVGSVLRQVYLGLNPYLKRWSARMQRVHTRQNGLPQWYGTKAPIGQLGEAALWFALDCSGSMVGTRLATMKAAVVGVLQNLRGIGNDSPLDIGIARWSAYRSIMIRRNVSSSDVDELIDFVNSLVADGGTDFNQAVADAGSYFAGSGDKPRIVIFMTDGVPSPVGSASTASTTLFAIEGVKSYAFNIDLADTTYTSMMDNTPDDGVPVASGSDTASIQRIIADAIFRQIDMNPAHIIRECLTDPDWGMGYPEADIDDVAFMAAADQLYDEAMGISLLWDRQATIEDFMAEVLRHINGALYVDRSSGKFTLKLIRHDYDEADLITLGEDDIENVEGYGRPTFGELLNSITVNYWDANTGNTASVQVDDPALIQMQGVVIGNTKQYPGFTNAAVAARAAQSDLRAFSSALLSCTIYASRKASKLNIADVFKFEWPNSHDGYIVMRVTGIALGDGRTNKVRITCTEDVFALPAQSVVAAPPSGWGDPSGAPMPATTRLLVEAPYYELVQRLGQTQTDTLLSGNPDAGYFLATAAAPAAAINATLMVDAGGGYEDAGVVDFSPDAVLAVAAGPADITFSLESAADLSRARIGSHLQIGSELVRLDAVAGSSITVGRGVLDTVPTLHPAGTVILAWDDYAEGDEVEYVAGETVAVKLLPVSGAGSVALDAAIADLITFQGRSIRPYPPGNFKVNGVYFPQTIGGSSALNLSWAHRDRLQQTAGSLQDFTAGDIGPESGVTYTLRIYGENGILLRYEPSVSAVSYVYDVLTELTDQGSSASVDPYWDSVVSLLHLNANFTDEKGKSWSSGSAVTSTTQYKFGGRSAGTFSSTVYKQAAASSDWAFGTGDFTIEFWAYATSMPTTYYFSPIGNWQSGNGGWSAWLQPNGVVSFTHGHASPSGTITLNTWNLWSISKIDGVLYLHINGILVSQLADTNNFTQTGGPRIGGNYASTDYWRGYVDEVRITKGVGRYGGSNYAVPVAEFPNVGSTNRLNGKLTVELGSTRDAYNSLQKHSHIVRRRGYGFNYGEYYG